MRRSILALVTLVALLAAGAALAHKLQATGTNRAAATFTATPTAQTRTTTCTGPDGAYTITRGVYTGTSVGGTVPGGTQLTGNITVRTFSVVNTTKAIGWTKGAVVIRDATTGTTKARASLVGVNTGPKLDGLTIGAVRGAGKLIANFSATASATGTVTGELGADAPVAPTNSAILFNGACGLGGEDEDDDHGDHGGDDHQ
jgi:hypothetical protein